MNTTKHQYLMTLIRELEKEGTIKLDNFTMFVEETLQVKYKLRNYFNYPISEPQYDELIDYAEQLLDIDPTTSGRTKHTSGVQSASDDEWIAFTAKQDIKQGDFVVIDEQDNQSVIPAAQMEVSDTTLEDLKKGQPDYKVKTIDVDELIVEQLMDEYKDAALGKGYHYGAIYNFDEAKAILDKAPQELKMIWYYSPFQQYFIGDITAMTDFPFIYKNEDPSHSDYVKNTAVVGPFHSVEELDNYFDLMVREKVGIDDAYFTNNLAELVVAIKFYESRNDAGKYSTIIDSLWRELKSMLLGNI
jgi:tetratricopeptide (TPR) repeat protein